jgi:hypothetical protein
VGNVIAVAVACLPGIKGLATARGWASINCCNKQSYLLLLLLLQIKSHIY